MNVGFKGIYEKEILLVKITAVFWIISKVISYKLWLSDRLFPILPPFETIPNLPNQVHLILFVISLILLTLVFFFPKNFTLQVLLVYLETTSCLLDQMRWQPWEYQYLLMFLIFIFCRNNIKKLQQLIIFLIAVTYIHSGFHKLNGGFLYHIWEHQILKNFFHFSNDTISNTLVHYSGLFLGIIEASIGFGLLLFKNKKIFAFLAIVMHAFLLIFLIKNDINTVVWPWNLSFIIYLGLLLFDKNKIDFNLDFFKSKFNFAFVLIIGFVPFLSFFGLYPNFLSFNLYSGNVKQLIICIKNIEQHTELKPFISNAKKNRYCQNQFTISPNQWAFKELNVPICPDENVFRKLKATWDISFPNTQSIFIIYYYPYKKEDFIEIQ